MNNTLRLLCGIAAFLPLVLPAQDEIRETPWEQRDRLNAVPLPYENIREADVMWSKKIWRTIDVRQKMNLPFSYPQHSLIEILHTAAMRGDITAYDPTVDNADQFKKAMTTTEVAKVGTKNDTIEVINAQTLLPEMKAISNPLPYDRIIKYRVKEIWFFDTKTSTMQMRILGIAPVMEDFDQAGNYRGDMTMYWLYYPDLRNILAKEEVFNPNNDQRSLSWDDIFESRMFQSYITKESNVYDRAIAEYATGVDTQIESDRIRQRMFEYEHDLWDY